MRWNKSGKPLRSLGWSEWLFCCEFWSFTGASGLVDYCESGFDGYELKNIFCCIIQLEKIYIDIYETNGVLESAVEYVSICFSDKKVI